MRLVPFGATGVNVSHLCLGSMMFGERCDEAEAGRIVDAALDGGVTFIDTAPVYADGEGEKILGRLLKGRRDRFFLATKVNVPTGAEYLSQITPSLEASLERLQTDFVDLYLIHQPRPGMNPAAMLKALDQVVRDGKAHFVGCCNYPAWLFAHFNAVAAEMGLVRMINNQIPYNLIERGAEVEVLPQADAENIAITCYRPLMAGVLSGKYRPGEPMPAASRVDEDDRLIAWTNDHARGLSKLFAVAKEHDVPAARVAIAWLRDQRAVTCPIVGVSRLEHLRSAIDSFDLELTESETEELAQAFGTEVKEVSPYYGPNRRAFDMIEDS